MPCNQRFRAQAGLATLLLLLAGSLTAQEGRPARNPGDVKFWAVSDLAYDPTEPALLGARVANPADFRASFYSASREGRCTSTLVGPRVLLTAAHCVGNGATATVRYRDVDRRSVCTHAPGYPANETADWALCIFAAPLNGIRYETVNLDPGLVGVGTELLLTGFGCTARDGTGGNDGLYRIGEVPVTALPHDDDHDIETRGSVVLCYGDSGGPGFAYLDPQRTRRVQVSVNSRTSVDTATRLILDTSYLSSLSTPAAKEFLREWSAAHGARICGVHAGTANCRTTQ